jgi:hypothetical protein
MTNPAISPDPTGGRADIATLQALVEESRQLRADLRTAEHQQKFRFRWMQIFLGVLCVGVLALATLVIQNQKISAQIYDCTNSGGRCWDESRQRSKNNVLTILNTTIFVAECLNRFPEQPAQEEPMEECVRRELATGRQPVPIPTPVPRSSASAGSSGKENR